LTRGGFRLALRDARGERVSLADMIFSGASVQQPGGCARHHHETGLPSRSPPMVVFSIFIWQFAIIFFYFQGCFDYYIENNTRQSCAERAMRFLPVFLDTAAGVVIVVGSGEPALGKLRLLRAAGAHVRWFSRDADVAEETRPPSGQGRLEISFGDPLKADWSDAVAVVSAAGDALDARIAARARRHRIPVNVVDRPELSTFIFPAIVDRGEVVVAIGTGGASPVLARRLRELIEALLPARIGDLARLIGRHRGRFAAVPRALSPRRFWQNTIAGPIAEAVLAG